MLSMFRRGKARLARCACRSITILVVILPLFRFPAAAQQPPTFTDPETGVSYTVERYLVANYPVALVFAPDGRLFYTEKTTGNVRVVSPEGELQQEPVITLPTSAIAERGMLGIELDPNFEENGIIWVAHTAEATARDYAALNIVRFREEDGIGSDPEIMLSIPLETNALIHMGGNIHFDDQGLLYFSAGDQENPANSQDLTNLMGAISRFEVTADGLIPAPDNPFEDSPIYAYGLRNPFDFVIDPYSERVRIFAVENGDKCDDEVNVILPQFNYGAGDNYTCGGTAEGIDMAFYMPPLVSYTPTEAPTGILVYDHDAISEWQGDVFFCAWNNGKIRRMVLNESRSRAGSIHELPIGDAQCRIDIAIGPEGGLYFAMVGAEGGAIYRLLRVDE